MIARALAALALAVTGAAAVPETRMTAAEADRLSPAELASRLLGAAGEVGAYVEKRVWANAGGLIASPGLNAVDLLGPPHSAGFEGLCDVDGVTVSFVRSARSDTGDEPHRVHDFRKFKRFLILAPVAGRRGDADWKQRDRDCRRLSPVVGRSGPAPFAVRSDRPADAYFAMRAIAKAQKDAASGAIAVACTPDSEDSAGPLCRGPAAALAALPIRDLSYASVDRCPEGPNWCVEARWRTGSTDNRDRATSLYLATDATRMDPLGEFHVTKLTLKAETWVYD